MRGEVQIILDKPRLIRFNLYALALAEKELGIPVTEMMNTKLPLNTILVLLWCALKSEDESLTLEQVGKMVTADKIAETIAAVQQALVESFGEVDQGNVQEVQGEKVNPGTGKKRKK